MMLPEVTDAPSTMTVGRDNVTTLMMTRNQKISFCDVLVMISCLPCQECLRRRS